MNRLFCSVLLLACLLGIATADTCGGNCPRDTCDGTTCETYCGSTPKQYDGVAALCKDKAWFGKKPMPADFPACCQCIANIESRGNAAAMNKNKGSSWDIGLFQINTINWADCVANNNNPGAALCDPTLNAACAAKVFKGAQRTFKRWAQSTRDQCATACAKYV